MLKHLLLCLIMENVGHANVNSLGYSNTRSIDQFGYQVVCAQVEF